MAANVAFLMTPSIDQTTSLVLAGEDGLNLCVRLALRFGDLDEYEYRSENHETSEEVESRTCEGYLVRCHKIALRFQVLPDPHEACIMPKVFVIMKTKVQLNMTAMADATPLTSLAKSSPIIICK